jgi:hypothetical protein
VVDSEKIEMSERGDVREKLELFERGVSSILNTIDDGVCVCMTSVYTTVDRTVKPTNTKPLGAVHNTTLLFGRRVALGWFKVSFLVSFASSNKSAAN